MSKNVNTSAFLLLVKVAQADGHIDPTERELLESFAEEMVSGSCFDTLSQQAADSTVSDLCENLSLEADRFFIRLRCHLMVEVDGEVDSSEQKMLDEVISHLPLSEKAEELLDTVLDHQSDESAEEPDMQAVQSLYEVSSFAQ